MNVVKSIFISHATPNDNQFSLWLALRLMSLGYEVWCDLLSLSKGGDFWSEIETQIRLNTFKFLLVQSKISNSREGVLKEIAVAQKVKKIRNDANFIVPLKIDPNLSYDDINVDVIRLNSIDFTKSWAIGFTDLQKALIEQKCPREKKSSTLSTILDKILNSTQTPVKKDESYDSNWFDIQNPPEYINFFPVKNSNIDLSNLPLLNYKNHIVTFLELNSLPQSLQNQIIHTSCGYHLKVSDYLNNDKKTDFICTSTFRKLYVAIMSKVFECSINKFPGIKCYKQSRYVSFWYPKGTIEKDCVGRIHLVGKYKQYHWHFAISGNVKLLPVPLLQVRSHVIFTTNGTDIESSDAIQHKARRSIGKNWWNKEWRTRLLAFIKSLKYMNENEYFVLTEGVNDAIRISCTPIQFIANFSYTEPGQAAEFELKESANEDASVWDIEGDEDCDK